MLSITLDWLAGTFKEHTHEAEQFMRTYASFPTVHTDKPRNGYSEATRDDNGTVIMWNIDRSDMGYHVIFAGSALRNIQREAQVGNETLLRAFVDAGGSVTRLDLAKDLSEQAIDYEAIYQSLKRRAGGGNARNVAKLENAQGGYTIYVGSRQSERFLRLYDKANEQGLHGVLWSRFEAETKGIVARAVAVSLIKSGNWAGVFDGLVLGMVGQYESVHLDDFVHRGDVPVGIPKIERQTDREAWIESQVLPACCRHYIDNPNSEAIARLIATLQLIDRQRKE